MKRQLQLIAPVALIAACLLAALPGLRAAQPNILFIYADDQATWTLGAYGNPQAATPNLDRLAKQGALFSNAFALTPVCSPSRVELMTSRYGVEMGIRDFLVMPGHKRLKHDPSLGLRADVPTFPEVLSAAGYQTALVGKWRLGQAPRFHPLKHGYQYFAGFLEGGTVVKDPTLEIDGKQKRFKGLTVDVLTAEAERFIDQRDATRPFLLSLHYRSPHGPWKPVAPEDAKPFQEADLKLPHPDYSDLDTAKVKRMMGEHLASARGVDRNVGRLMTFLEDRQLHRDTIVIFTADHGYNMGHNGIHHKGNGIWATKPLPKALPDIEARMRPNLYDQSMRVPLLVRWPGVTRPGQRVEGIVSNLDWFPTLVRMAGATMPSDALIRGRDFTSLLKDDQPDWDPILYGEYSMEHYGIADMRCMRTPEWKLVVDFHNRDRDELYDIRHDPEERFNLIRRSDPRVVAAKKRLFAELLKRKSRIDAGR